MSAEKTPWTLLCMAATHHLTDERMVEKSVSSTSENDVQVDPTISQLLCQETLKDREALAPEQSGDTSEWVESPQNSSGGNAKYVRGIPTVSKRDIQWNTMFKRLQKFKREYGHCNVPQGYTVDRELATWVKNQRQAYRYMLERKSSKRISLDRIARLNRIGFEWRKNARSVDLWRQPRVHESTEVTERTSQLLCNETL